MTIPLLQFQPRDASNLGLEIIEIETLYKRSVAVDHDPFKPHRLKFYNLIYISKGSGSHFIDFKHYPFKAGSFIFVNKHQTHAFDHSHHLQGKAVLFTQSFLESTSVHIRMPFFASKLMRQNAPVLTVSDPLKHGCESILDEMDRELKCHECDSLITQLLFSVLLLKLNRKRPASYYDNDLTEQQALKFTAFIELIEKSFTENRDASAYAKRLSMTYKSLNKVCKLACDQTPKQLIDTHTILEAKRRLVIEKVKVNQLAFDLGFEEVSNFIKYFKKHTLITPAQFKSNQSR